MACWRVTEIDLGIFLWNTKMGWGGGGDATNIPFRKDGARVCVCACVHI